MTLAEPQFTQVSGTNLYWLDGSNQTIGFQATSGSALGGTPLLSATWTDTGGIYLFLAEAPTNVAQFESNLVPYLTGFGWPNGPRFLWLHNPNDLVSLWSGQVLAMTNGSVTSRTDFGFKNYTFSVPSGVAVGLATEAQGFGFTFGGGTLFAPGGQYSAQDSSVLIPMTGANIACWRFSIQLMNGAASPTDFMRLNVGLRYFYPEDLTNTNGDIFIRALELPTIAQVTTPIMLDVSLDPFQPLVPQRTFFSFFPAGAGAQPTYSSNFATARGYSVSLTPLSASGGIPDARLVFGIQPLFIGSDSSVPTEYYLTFDGAFQIGWGATTNDFYRLLVGGSGLEYLGMPKSGSSQLQFLPGNSAFAPLVPTSKATDLVLNSLGTTSWVYATAANTIQYFAQPEDAPLYWAPPTKTNEEEIGSIFLDFLEVPALNLAAQSGNLAFPVAPYFGLDPDSVQSALVVESSALAPTRRVKISAANASFDDDFVGITSKVGVTPQGIAVGIASDGMSWTWTGVANDTGGQASEPDLKFSKVSGKFRQSLQTNNLFLVLTNANEFAKYGSVSYMLTAEEIAEIAVENPSIPPTVISQITAFFNGHNTVYDTEDDFNTALHTASNWTVGNELIFQRKAGLLAPKIGDWNFQMSPRNWSNPDRNDRQNMMVIYKFGLGRSLEDLVADVGSWSWPEVSCFPGEHVDATQIELQDIFQKAKDSDQQMKSEGRQSAYANFVKIIGDDDWTGILALSVDVPLRSLPDPLQALAAGIDRNRFYAHHIGFNVTPFGADPGNLVFGSTSTFGLIDYQDPVDQVVASGVTFAFKVLALTVGFRNSKMTDFSSRLELMINRLFGTTPNLYPTDHGNNVILEGVYQKQQGSDGLEHGTYVFSMARQNSLLFAESALQQIVLNSTQLVMTKTADPTNPQSQVIATFLMGGDMSLRELPAFDLFSFGSAKSPSDSEPLEGESYLRFGNLGIQMQFTMANPQPTFTLITETLSFDMANSKPRDKSLYKRFPLVLTGFVATNDPGTSGGDSTQDPSTMGYVSVGAPIQQSKMTDPWYGLIFDIDLGSLGALAASGSLTLRVLAGWSGGGEGGNPGVYLGVQIPGVKNIIGAELPLQGVISLGFRSIQFLANDDDEADTREYMLRFRNFSLSFLGFSFPPGYNDILLVGNPDQTSTTKLAWYAAYAKEDDKKKGGAVRSRDNALARTQIPVLTREEMK